MSPVAVLWSVSRTIATSMSCVSAGRLLIAMWKVISPVSSFETVVS